MNDRYENLEDVDLFESRETDLYSEDSYLGRRVGHVDSLFEAVDERPQVYPIEETLSTITMGGSFAPGDDIVLAVAGNIKDHILGLEIDDFKSYHGEYLQTEEFDDTYLKIDQPEVEAKPSDIDTMNIRFEIPVGQSTIAHEVPPENPSTDIILEDSTI